MQDLLEHSSSKVLFLHIGSEKTGSTAIQQFLKNNVKILEDFNISYPIFNLESMISAICVPFANKDSVSDCLVFKSVSFYLRQLDNTFTDKTSQLKQNVIISSELLHSRLRTNHEILKLRNFLLKYFDTIVPIVYIRDPWAKALSLLSTGLKSGKLHLNIESMKTMYFYHSCSIKASVNLWTNVFPNTVVIDYDDLSNQSSSKIYESFLSAIKLDKDCFNLFRYQFEKKANPALSLREAYILSIINSMLHTLCFTKLMQKIHQKFNRLLIVYLFPLLPKNPSSIKSFFCEADKLEFLDGLSTYENKLGSLSNITPTK